MNAYVMFVVWTNTYVVDLIQPEKRASFIQRSPAVAGTRAPSSS
jgi:hypothetical protein